jgi:N,N'-diacetyllegionaminate synthase
VSTFIIAEAGVNHNGDLDKALELVRIAADAGADAVKYQTFSADQLIAPGTETVGYQKAATGETDQHQLLNALELSRDAWERIVEEARRCKIEFMSTAFDHASADYLVELGIRRVKVPSGEITNQPFLKHLARAGLPVILSTGMADLDEIREAVAVVEGVQREVLPGTPRAERLVVLQCTSAYPTPLEDANLAAMTTIARELDVPIGLSDHTVGTLLAPVAVGMGARVIEKHFTLDRSLPGPDHAASLEPDELKTMVRNIRAVEAALGDGVKTPRPSEIETRALARRGIKAARDLAPGETITAADIAILRPQTGLAPAQFDALLGRTVRRARKTGEPLQWTDVGD